MKFVKNLLTATVAALVLAGCNDNSSSDSHEAVETTRFATYNLSFDRSSYGALSAEMSLSRAQQDALLDSYQNNRDSMSDADKETAKKVIQIRNVAETIQRANPDVFVLAEFNNNGSGDDKSAINGFQENYLGFAQGADTTAVTYGYRRNFATNTGLQMGMDLNRDGKVDDGPNDAAGFGFYHGQFAFSVFSKHPVDDDNTRTFQDFKWKDMPGEKNIVIDQCDSLPTGQACGDSWYKADDWDKLPLSSKNHVDLPVLIPTVEGTETVHFLVSHPAPPIYDNVARHNTKRNLAEVKFWNDYIASENYIYDDAGKTGGLEVGAKFVIAGDLNADPLNGDGDPEAIRDLLHHSLVNNTATVGNKKPVSLGAEEYLTSPECKRGCDTAQDTSSITNISSLRLDYVIPSANIEATDSGVFWPASHEDGFHLVYDNEQDLNDSGTPEVGKGVSSDHRLVWMDLNVSD